ncbi:hypothetical protein AAVH_26343 [Aphelenchoides avenae]|nr:hypothetical protein AAVH_26343 [Aphelenchus avenae]
MCYVTYRTVLTVLRGRGRGGGRREESKDDLAVIFPKDAAPALLTTRLSDEKRDWVPLFKLDARGEVPVDAEPEPLKYSFFLNDGNVRLGRDSCDVELEKDECTTSKTATCVLCLRTRAVDILVVGRSVKATIIIEDTWGYSRMRVFSYFDLVQKMESNLDQIHIQSFTPAERAKLDDAWFKEKRKTLGIRITATDFDLSEATMIADVISRIMQTARPARPIPGHVTEEINRYLQLPTPAPKWTVLVDNTGQPLTWHIQTLLPSRSFLAFVKEERQYYIYRLPPKEES